MIDVIVVGAGWSGLTAATRLASLGYSVVVVEKSRGPGGRSATRRIDGFSFDHGAQYLTARSDAFARQVEAWSGAGLLASWDPAMAVFGHRPDHAGKAPANRWVGLGGMNAVLHRLAEGVDCRCRWPVVEVGFDGKLWQVSSASGESLMGRSLLLTAPPAQAVDLLGSRHPLSPRLESVDMLPCWAVMAGFDKAPDVAFDAAFVNEGPLSWIARSDSKAGSRSGPAWIGHATADWSMENLALEPEAVAPLLLAAMGELDSGLGSQPAVCTAHLWRYAMARSPIEGPILADDGQKLVLAGDWCAGERIEGAWISGVSASRRLQSLL